ncbi:MAG: protein phosphatase CheZ [Zavarzinia sp.]|nr:protein phosphatase CheZ [Zavarzinia sp.]
MSFEERLAALSASTGGMVPVGEIGRIVAALLESWDGERPQAETAPPLAPAATATAGAVEGETARELENLLAVSHQTRTEIAAIRPDEIARERIPHANDQLRSVVDATEHATGVFLDIAEELEALAETFGGAGINEIHSITTRIYEASNFQDITGQRIAKVTETLGVIEERLSRLIEMTGGLVHKAPEAPSSTATTDDIKLLNGPQLPAVAASQDDIDRLFASI